MTLHYATLHHTALQLRCIPRPCVTLHYMALHDLILQDLILQYVHTYIHTYIHTHIHTCIHAYIHTCIHTYMFGTRARYIHTYIHTYVHTYIHKYSAGCQVQKKRRRNSKRQRDRGNATFALRLPALSSLEPSSVLTLPRTLPVACLCPFQTYSFAASLRPLSSTADAEFRSGEDSARVSCRNAGGQEAANKQSLGQKSELGQRETT